MKKNSSTRISLTTRLLPELHEFVRGRQEGARTYLEGLIAADLDRNDRLHRRQISRSETELVREWIRSQPTNLQIYMGQVVDDPEIAPEFKTPEILTHMVKVWHKNIFDFLAVVDSEGQSSFEATFASLFSNKITELRNESIALFELEEDWIQQCVKLYPETIFDSQAWVKKAEELLRCAETLWLNLVSVQFAKKDCDGLPVLQMLCGFALENILKGLVIAKTPLKKRQQIYNYASRELSKRLCTHNLEDLWRMVGGLGYEVPPPILGRLTIAVLSNGRYPVASKIGTFAKGWSWGSTDWTTVKELVDEIKKSYPA